MTTAEDIQTSLNWSEPTPSAIFNSVSIVSKYVMEFGADNPTAIDAIVRLRDTIDHPVISNDAIKDAVYSLCREAGLFPYLEEEALTWRDQVAYEFFRGPESLEYVFHREQWEAFQLLKAGKSLVLSAPTSFGKSVLIHAFIAEKQPNCVVVIVPTIALLDQFRRRLTKLFGSDYTIITRNDQAKTDDKKQIYVLTQERLLDRDDIDEIDLLAIDEYYKLDNRRDKQGEGSRAALLNAALRRFMGISKQIFFLGPTVAEIPMRADIASRFEKHTTSFSTVAVDLHNLKESKEPQKTLSTLLRRYRTDKSLIFSKSPPAARALSKYLADSAPLKFSGDLRDLTDWLAEHYHPSWSLVSSLKSGYGLHHGSIPRSVGQAVVRHFNERDLQALICTSTLIEGVNTTAKNVFIFDKKISNTNYDYFDFRNIAGRSGRMGHHFVGRIFLFHEPPAVAEYQLQIPALGEDDRLPNATLLNLPDETLSRESLARKNGLLKNSSHPPELVKRFAPYGDDSLQNISSETLSLLKSGDRELAWRGNVGFKELAVTFELAWKHLRFNRRQLTPRAAAFFANRLRISGSLRNFFDRLAEGKPTLEQADIIDRGFRALSAFDYSIPKVLLDIEMLVNFHCANLKIDLADYSYMAQGLDNLFQHHWVKALDEYGVPFPLGRKLSFLVRDEPSLENASRAVLTYSDSSAGMKRLSSVERLLIREALA